MSASTLVSKWHGERANFSSASPLRNTAIVSPRRSYRFGSAPLQLYSSHPLSFLGGPGPSVWLPFAAQCVLSCSLSSASLSCACAHALCGREDGADSLSHGKALRALYGIFRRDRSALPLPCCPCPAICSLCPCTCSRPPQILALHICPRLLSCFLSSSRSYLPRPRFKPRCWHCRCHLPAPLLCIGPLSPSVSADGSHHRQMR